MNRFQNIKAKILQIENGMLTLAMKSGNDKFYDTSAPIQLSALHEGLSLPYQPGHAFLMFLA